MPMSELSSGAKQLQESMQRLFIAARNGDLTPNEYRKEQQRLLSSAPPSIAQELIEYNTVLNTDLLNETQFYREPTLPVDEAAYDAVTYMGRVPFGSEDSKYLYRRGSSGVRGANVEPTEYGKSVGGIEHILIAGRNLYNENTPVIEHEGLHAVGEPQGVDDEVATRALDYFRYQRLGDEEGMRRVAEGLRKNGFSAFDPENPESMKFLRLYAAKKAMSMDPEYLDLMDKEALSAAHDARIEEPGIFDALGELVGGEPAEPEFEPFLMGPRHMRDFSDEEFQTFLDEAPAFQYEPMETQPRTSTVTPRMVPEGESAVKAYEFGGVAGINQDRFEAAADRLRNTSPETFFSDMRELMKSPRVEGREYGDVLPFISRERVDRGPEGIDTTYYLDSGASGIAGTIADKVFEMGEKATEFFYPDADAKVQNYQNGGGVGYFERPEGEYGVEPSQFEQDVTQQPGRVYDTLVTPRSRAETVPHPLYGEVEEPYEFDPAGGIMGMASRALSTFDRKLSGLPVSDEQLAGAAMDIVPTSAGIASAAFGPALSPGMLGMFITKHGSPFDFNVFRRPTKEDVGLTSTRANLGPAIYSGEEPVATAFAQKFARRKAAGEEDESYDVATLFGDPEDQVARPQMYDLSNPDAEEGLSLVLQDASARANTHVPDLAGQRSFYFFDDGSALIHNYAPNPGTPRIQPLDKGEAFVYTAKVNADKDQYLDWSAPFFKQSEFVRNTLRPFLKKYGIDDRSTGQQMWNTIAEANNGDAMTANAILEQAGIKGNKVVQSGNEILATFNPDDMSIVDKQELGKVLGYADGGVVSLKDVAVNMNRRPRHSGIMKYVPYMTGATNGY